MRQQNGSKAVADAAWAKDVVAPRLIPTDYDPLADWAASSDWALLSKRAFVRVPNKVIASRHTIKTIASITAYSTAVGPSSEMRNRRIRSAHVFM
jgi:hypothetical protein